MQTDTPRKQWADAYRHARHMRNLADMLDGKWPSNDTFEGSLAKAASLAVLRRRDRLSDSLPIRRGCGIPWIVGRAAIVGPRGKLP